jgi:hypothetical protein
MSTGVGTMLQNGELLERRGRNRAFVRIVEYGSEVESS